MNQYRTTLISLKISIKLMTNWVYDNMTYFVLGLIHQNKFVSEFWLKLAPAPEHTCILQTLSSVVALFYNHSFH